MPGNSNDKYDLVLATHPEALFFCAKAQVLGIGSTRFNLYYFSHCHRSATERCPSIPPYSAIGCIRTHCHGHSANRCYGKNWRLQQNGSHAVFGEIAEGVYAWVGVGCIGCGARYLGRTAGVVIGEKESGSENRRGSLPAQVQCAHCGKASVPLMLCARCRAVSYCRRSCQATHFSEYKVICRSTASRVVTDG